MFIWGRKLVRRHLGYVADFCPICACARPFALTRLGSAGHVYFIAAGDGDVIGHERRCRACTVVLRANPARYAAIEPVELPIRALVARTLPAFKALYAERLTLEASLRADPRSPSPQVRQELLLEPFTLMAVRVSERFETWSFDIGGAFMKREVLPVLARALRRLKPTRQELKAVLGHLRQQREPIGSKLRLDDLVSATDAAADPALAMPMTEELPGPRRDVGRLLRGLAWLVAAALGVAAWLSLRAPGAGGHAVTVLGLLLLGAALVYGLHCAGRAVSRGQTWGRVSGLAVGVVLLGGFPVGTAVGVYVLFKLGLRWHADID